MEPVQYLRAFRQWWYVIVAATLIGVVIGVAAAPGSATQYTASHEIVQASTAATANTDVPVLSRVAFLATRGSIPDQVAKRLGRTDGQNLASQVEVTADDNLGILTIKATGSNARDTERLADAFATELIASRDKLAASQYQQQVDLAQAQISSLRAQIAAINPLTTNPALLAQNDALTGQYSNALSALDQLTSQGTPTSGLTSVEPSRAVGGASGSTSTSTRVVIGGLVGLLLGAGLALALTRFDTRIRTKEEAEQAFGLPVLAEIPVLARGSRNRKEVISMTDPESSGAEAYRRLRTSLGFGAPSSVRWKLNDDVRDPRGRDAASESALSQTILVVSPGVGEGKSTTVANLAVAFARAGKYVLVLSGDLRRPMVDRYLGVEPGPGMSELLALEDDIHPEDLVRTTAVANVRMISSGDLVSNPGELLSHHGVDLLDAANRLADVILIDSPPLLATDDITSLLPRIDKVLVVCRAGVTNLELARRTTEMLGRFGASVAGVALVGALPAPGVREYYGSYQRWSDTHERDADAPSPNGTGARSRRAKASDRT